MPLLEVLGAHPFAADLRQEHVAELASVAALTDFGQGELALRAGEPSTALYLIVTGAACIELCLPCCTATVQCLGRGDVFGWSALLGDAETMFQVRAATDVLALRLDGARLLQLCRADPTLGVDILYRVLRVVAGRVEASEARFTRLIGAGTAVEPRLTVRKRRVHRRERG